MRYKYSKIGVNLTVAASPGFVIEYLLQQDVSFIGGICLLHLLGHGIDKYMKNPE